MRVVQKVLNLNEKSRAEHLCNGNTLPLFIELEKLIQIFIALSEEVVCYHKKKV